MDNIVQSLWIGVELSRMEKLSIKSFLDNGHEYHLYIYNDVKGIPNGVKIMDANEILSSVNIFKYPNHDSYAGFANMFRYKLLFDRGGIWVDTDIICLKPFYFKQDNIICSQYNYFEINKKQRKIIKINNCVIKSLPRSEIMEYCFHKCSMKDHKNLHWGETGPKLVHEAYIKHNLIQYVAHPNLFCPVDWWEWEYFICDPISFQLINFFKPRYKNKSKQYSVKKLTSQVRNSINLLIHKPYSYHLWNEMWRRGGIDKNNNFKKKSIYGKYLKKHKIC